MHRDAQLLFITVPYRPVSAPDDSAQGNFASADASSIAPTADATALPPAFITNSQCHFARDDEFTSRRIDEPHFADI